MKSYERRFKIGHIEHAQQVGFRFILSNDADVEPRIHSFNEAGDVEFIPRSISKAMDERLQIARFIKLYLLFIIVPSIFGIMMIGELNTLATGIARLAILISMIPVLNPTSKVISDAIMRIAYPKEDISKSSAVSLAISDSPSSRIYLK